MIVVMLQVVWQVLSVVLNLVRLVWLWVSLRTLLSAVTVIIGSFTVLCILLVVECLFSLCLRWLTVTMMLVGAVLVLWTRLIDLWMSALVSTMLLMTSMWFVSGVLTSRLFLLRLPVLPWPNVIGILWLRCCVSV